MILNELMELPEYMHSPSSTVEVLFGGDYPVADYTDLQTIRRSKCRDMLDHAEILRRFSLNVVDRPARYLSESLRVLNYRVSPAGPIVLHLSGVDTEEAWSMNRTLIVRTLYDIGQAELANPYVQYYLYRWKFFVSDYEDFDSARSAARAGIDVVQKRAASLAKTWLSANEE